MNLIKSSKAKDNNDVDMFFKICIYFFVGNKNYFYSFNIETSICFANLCYHLSFQFLL